MTTQLLLNEVLPNLTRLKVAPIVKTIFRPQ